jgi:predicted RNA polymerase sigma factor
MPGLHIASRPRPAPGAHERGPRGAVSAGNEGYAASTGSDLIRVDLCVEAIRLGRVLSTLMPDEPEVGGLLALLLFQHSRRSARVDQPVTWSL